MNRRAEITMSPDEVAAFLREERLVTCATLGRRGWPHVVPLWYVLRDVEIWAWTYAKSQKTRNLERDPRATLSIEAGEEYSELRGVMIEAQTTIHRDTETVAAVGLELLERNGDAGRGEVVSRQAAKRVALQFTPQRIASFDHRKLGGRY
jgi:PPOX class probable F420-dependent enzyme